MQKNPPEFTVQPGIKLEFQNWKKNQKTEPVPQLEK